MKETILIGGDNRNPPMYKIEVEDNEVKRIDVYSSTLKCHFEAEQWAYDFHRYIQLNKKELNEVGTALIDNKEDWGELNNLHDKLFDLYMRHFDRNFDKDTGYLSERNNHYSTIAYRCINFVPRKFKTINYINQLLGVYANNL